MRNFYLLLLWSICSFSFSHAQMDSFRDSQWAVGWRDEPDDTLFGGAFVDFKEEPALFSYSYWGIGFQNTNASICDREGNLLFYSNGIWICNRFGDTIATGLNPGVVADLAEHSGYNITNGAFVLPAPENEELYYLIHERQEYYEEESTFTSFYLYYTLVDMSTPEGELVSKNNLIRYDTFDIGHTTAVRHANGRDWWIVKARYGSNAFDVFLLDPSGIHLDHIETAGEAIDRNGGVGQAVFSPDGSMYARNDGTTIAGPQRFKLYDFDRCSGSLGNMREDSIFDMSYGQGMAFSPNSRYLYVSTGTALYQYDTEAEDFAASRVLIAEWDGYYAPYPSHADFFMMQLGPDNKIYISSTDPVYAIHIIHQPDEAGLACDLEIGMILPTFNYTLPHFPHYRLGALPDSPCDSLGTVGAKELVHSASALNLWVGPNPVARGGLLQVKLPEGNWNHAALYWYDAQARRLPFKKEVEVSSSRRVNCTAPAGPGLYWLVLVNEKGRRLARKVAVY